MLQTLSLRQKVLISAICPVIVISGYSLAIFMQVRQCHKMINSEINQIYQSGICPENFEKSIEKLNRIEKSTTFIIVLFSIMTTTLIIILNFFVLKSLLIQISKVNFNPYKE
jgi:ABC-type transporter Mla maintaining outer membrane lipid asymmetry permease subunit MlaE